MIGLGEVHQVAVDVRDADGALTTPADMTLTITLPDGTAVTPDVPAPAEAGRVRVDYVTTVPGRHAWRLTTMTPTTAYADIFEVLPADAGQIVSLADAKKHLNIPLARTTDDDELRDFMVATTSVIERYVGAVIPQERVDTLDGGPSGKAGVLLTRRPVLSIASVTENGRTVAAGGYTLDAEAGVLRRRLGLVPYTWQAGIANIAVTYTAGRRIVPANFSRAALIILKHMWETQRSSGGGRPGLGEEVAGPATYMANPNAYAIPYRALELLGEPTSGIA